MRGQYPLPACEMRGPTARSLHPKLLLAFPDIGDLRRGLRFLQCLNSAFRHSHLAILRWTWSLTRRDFDRGLPCIRILRVVNEASLDFVL